MAASMCHRNTVCTGRCVLRPRLSCDAAPAVSTRGLALCPPLTLPHLPRVLLPRDSGFVGKASQARCWLHRDLGTRLMILVPVSEVRPATSHPPATPDPVGVGPGDRKWATTGMPISTLRWAWEGLGAPGKGLGGPRRAREPGGSCFRDCAAYAALGKVGGGG